MIPCYELKKKKRERKQPINENKNTAPLINKAYHLKNTSLILSSLLSFLDCQQPAVVVMYQFPSVGGFVSGKPTHTPTGCSAFNSVSIPHFFSPFPFPFSFSFFFSFFFCVCVFLLVSLELTSFYLFSCWWYDNLLCSRPLSVF